MIGLLAALVACSDPAEPAEPAEPAPAPASPASAPTLDFVVSSTIHFIGVAAAPHRLRVSYQGADLCRWELKRLDDEDADRLIEYRSHERAFKLPQDEVVSIEYGPEESQQVFARMALRHLVLTDDPTGDLWEERPLPGGLGRVQREVTSDGRIVYRHFDPAGKAGETLTVLTRFETRGRSWPKELELTVGEEPIWTETVDQIQTQSWFAEAYFVPPDRSTALSPK